MTTDLPSQRTEAPTDPSNGEHSTLYRPTPLRSLHGLSTSPALDERSHSPRSILSISTDSYQDRGSGTSRDGESPISKGSTHLSSDDIEPPISVQPQSPLSPTTALTNAWPGFKFAETHPAESSSTASARAGFAHLRDGSIGRNQPSNLGSTLHGDGTATPRVNPQILATDGVQVGSSEDEGLDEEEDVVPHPPIFSRTLSAPLPSRVGHLRNPYKTERSRFASPPSLSHHSSDKSVMSLPANQVGTLDVNKDLPTPGSSSHSEAVQTLSHELADSLQSAIQTLLHLSPPHLLDNAKEQYSGCTVQMPSTSFSALFTAMKGLNYLSANFQALCDEDDKVEERSAPRTPTPPSKQCPSPRHPSLDVMASKSATATPPSLRRPASTHSLPPLPMPRQGMFDDQLGTTEDFDIGELLQSTADLLSGQAAQAGVELVLFHGDVGIKHVSVKGDGEGLGYALSVVLRQVLAVCKPGDCLELGLQLTPQSPSQTPKLNSPPSAAELQVSRAENSGDDSAGRTSPGKTMATHHESGAGPMLCTFEIVHNISPTPLKSPAETPKAETPMFAGNDVERDEPDFNTLLCRRILRHVNATLHSGLVEESPPLAAGSVIPPPRRTYELAVLLATGQPIIEPTILSAEEQAARQPFPSLRLAREPTLNELADFAETLRGKRVELHASLKSLFARHLTSYLAAWGMDIRHTPIEECDENEAMRVDTSNMSGLPTSSQDSGYGGGAVGGRSQTQESAAALRTGAIDLDQPPAEQIIIIDDDVGVLKKQLLKIRAESPVLSMRSRNLKRPALSLRAKSSPQVRSLQAGVTAGKMPQPIRPSNSVVIHFTSISRYNHVRDVVAGILAISPEASFYQPEVMVIPKPVGPRRFLTALHTALDRPIVDPYFSPIATSPRSPGGSYFSAKPSRAPSAFDGMGASHFSAVPEEVYEGDVLREPSDDSIAQVKVKSPNMEGNASTGGLSPSARFQDPTHLQIATPSGEIVATSAMEYFSEAVSKLGSSAASGLLVQSPDGRPVGMYFDPPSRGEGRRPSQAKADTRRRSSIRGTTPVMEQGAFGAAVGTSPTSRRHSLMSSGSHHDTVESRRSSTLQDLPDEDDGQTSKGARRDSRTSNASTSSRRKTTITTITPPSAPRNRDRSSTVTGAGQGGGARSPSPTPSKQGDASKVLPAPPLESPYNVADSALNSLPKVGSKKAAAIEAKLAAKAKAAEETAAAIAKVAAPKKAASKDGVVVPPINVLIVEDNPINQNILSMFLRKKKIKHQAAKDGQEAVEKWRTGVFHLILMDIQLPVMDGIEATKEIRRLEKSNNIGVFPSTPNTELSASPLRTDVPATPLRSSVIIVALTASSLQSDRVNALAAGCNDFLTKPVSLKWLENKIVEWGCMQALIDFEGWRRWKSADGQGPKSLIEARRAFQNDSDAKAKRVASLLRIDRTGKTPKDSSLTSPNAGSEAAPNNLPSEVDELGADLPNIQVQKPTPLAPDINGAAAFAAPETAGHSTLPTDSSDTVIGEANSGAEVLHQGIEAAQRQLEKKTTQVPFSSPQESDFHNAFSPPSSGSNADTVSDATTATNATPRQAPPLPRHSSSTTPAPPPHLAVESIQTDPQTSEAPGSNPVDIPRLHSELPGDLLLDPDVGGADDGPNPPSEPSSGESSGPPLGLEQTLARGTNNDNKPLPPLPS